MQIRLPGVPTTVTALAPGSIFTAEFGRAGFGRFIKGEFVESKGAFGYVSIGPLLEDDSPYCYESSFHNDSPCLNETGLLTLVPYPALPSLFKGTTNPGNLLLCGASLLLNARVGPGRRTYLDLRSGELHERTPRRCDAVFGGYKLVATEPVNEAEIWHQDGNAEPKATAA